jgi:hypothetical protein
MIQATKRKDGSTTMGAPVQARLTRLIIQVGQLDLNDETQKLQVWITFGCESETTPGKVFSLWHELDRAKTVTQRRTDLRQLALSAVPDQFDGGAVQATNFVVEYLGI